MFRRRRASAPHFRTPVPYNPLTGEYERLSQKPAQADLVVGRVAAIYDDYLVCEAWTPDQRAQYDSLLVAKPFLLRANPDAGVRFSSANQTYSATASGDRDAKTVRTTGDTDEFVQRQVIDPPYFLGDLIIAARIESLIGKAVLYSVPYSGYWSRTNELYLPADMPVSKMSVGGTPVYWMDINVAGRRWTTSRLLRFEMVDALSVGGSAEVLLQVWDSDTSTWTEDADESTFTVYDFQNRFSKMATTSGDKGALGIAEYMPDKDAWEIVTMQTPGDFWGTLNANLDQTDASVSVASTDVLVGYDVFGAFHGANITAYNPVGGGNEASYWWAGSTNDACYCHWDMDDEKYWILAVEPNARGYQSLTVVTSVNFGASTTTTATIELPPWTDIT